MTATVAKCCRTCPATCRPSSAADDQLTAAARLIRRLHDETAGSSLAHGAEIVCHNDLSPCNFVFVENLPQAIIDFDDAAPGSRAADLGYAAWLWLDIGDDDVAIAPDEQARRLKVFAEAYGWRDMDGLIAAMIARQHTLIARAGACGRTETAAWARHCLAWTEAHLLKPATRRES